MNILKKNQLELIARAEWMAEQTNDYQLIKKYMSSRYEDIVLTDLQQLKLKRWQFIYDQLSSGKYSDEDVRHQIVQHFKISESQSYADLRTAKDLFSTTLYINKKFEIIKDIKLLEIMMRKAREANKGDDYAKLQKAKNELYKMLPDEDDVPGDYFEPRKNEFVYDPSLLGVTPISNDKMRDLIDQIKRETGIIDIDYTIIEDEHEENPL